MRTGIEKKQPMTGDPAPDFALQTVGGQAVSLQELVRAGQNVLLVFLRHLG